MSAGLYSARYIKDGGRTLRERIVQLAPMISQIPLVSCEHEGDMALLEIVTACIARDGELLGEYQGTLIETIDRWTSPLRGLVDLSQVSEAWLEAAKNPHEAGLAESIMLVDHFRKRGAPKSE
jgi:hypothetical protein